MEVFETALDALFTKVFEVRKVVYDQPGESREQECLFIEIENCNSSFKDAMYHARVTGKAIMFAPADKLPFGYFAKRIATHSEDLQDLFFFEIEENTRLYQNIVQRSLSFVYFFNSQYDPAIGTITSITTEVETT